MIRTEPQITKNWKYKSPPLVSIACVTYNHELYIAQAIESFLMQETTFPFEIIIHDDASTDETQSIIKKYAKRFPSIIKTILQTKNIWQNKRISPTFTIVFPCAKGKYIAWCEGDDYWTNPNKLQKQVEFLEANPDFSVCHHRIEEIFEEGIKPIKTKIIQKEVATFEDLAATGNFIYTASCVFRNNVSILPDWFNSMPTGDFILHLFNSQFGKIKFLDENMGVYRVHSGGIWTMKTEEEKNETIICLWKLCRKNFYPRAYREFSEHLANFNERLCFNYFEANKFKEFRKHYIECVRHYRFLKRKNLCALTFRYFMSYIPLLALWYKRIKIKTYLL